MFCKVGKFAVMTAVAATSACGPIENNAPRVAAIKFEDTRFETRLILLPRCPTDPDSSTTEAFAPLIGLALAAVIPVVADLATNALGNYLKAREDALTGSHQALTSGQLYADKGTPAFSCIVVARGNFGAKLASTVGGEAHGSLDARALTRAGLADFPDFYFEARVQLPTKGVSDTNVMTLVPNRLHLAKTAAGRTTHDAKTINMIFIMAQGAIDPKSPDKSKATAVVPMQFEKVKIGTEIPPSLLAGRTVNVPVAGPVLAKSTTFNAAPFNMLVTVEETEKAGAFEDLMVTTYASHQKDISTQIVAILKEALGIK